jgi:POT family proton-dependent oligopeptide transporter
MNSGAALEDLELAKAHEPKLHEELMKSERIDTLPEYRKGEIDESAIADGEQPTDEELLTLRRVSGQVPWTAYTVAVVELCERFSYYGTTAVCMVPRIPSVLGRC